MVKPSTGLLFAGGTVKPEFIRQRLLQVVSSWQPVAVKELTTTDLDLAITKGCALAPMQKELIKGGYPRTIFCETMSNEGRTKLICLVPKGYDGREPILLKDLGLKVRIGEPVQFQIYTDSGTATNKAGDTLQLDDAYHKLPPLITQLDIKAGQPGKKGELVAIDLEVSLSPAGLLDIFCREADGERRWQLSFQMRQTKASKAVVDSSPAEGSLISKDQFRDAKSLIEGIYGKSKGVVADPKTLIKDLESLFNCERSEWDLATLRQLWPSLSLGLTRRGRSVDHEYAFIYLAGFFLRPGYGDAYDRFRIEELWRLFQLGLNHPKNSKVQNQWWIMWRRVSGGLNKVQQEALFRKVYPAIKNDKEVSGEMILLAGGPGED